MLFFVIRIIVLCYVIVGSVSFPANWLVCEARLVALLGIRSLV